MLDHLSDQPAAHSDQPANSIILERDNVSTPDHPESGSKTSMPKDEANHNSIGASTPPVSRYESMSGSDGFNEGYCSDETDYASRNWTPVQTPTVFDAGSKERGGEAAAVIDRRKSMSDADSSKVSEDEDSIYLRHSALLSPHRTLRTALEEEEEEHEKDHERPAKKKLQFKSESDFDDRHHAPEHAASTSGETNGSVSAATDVSKFKTLDEILIFVRQLSDADLNKFFLIPQVQEIFSASAKKRGIFSYRMKEMPLLAYLSIDRVQALDAAAIASIIKNLQRSGIRDVDQISVLRLLVSQKDGDKLSLLKERLDPRGNFHSLHKLIFSDIVNFRMREALLQHFRQTLPHINRGTKIISDIDDTLVCSGGSEYFRGSWVGVDRRIPSGSIYPGILQLMKELDLGVSVDGHWPRSRLGNIIFLSARPHLVADWTERFSFNLFSRLVSKKQMHALPSFLSGDLSSVSAVWNNMEPMARKKFENFRQYASLYPEYDFVFVGDNGQADVHVAEMIADKWSTEKLKSGTHGLRACFIQQVQPRSLTYRGPFRKYEGSKTEREWAAKGIYFFRTYVGCATLAATLNIIHINAVARVGRAALNDFDHLIFATDPDQMTKREAYAAELNEDILRANELMRSMGSDEPQLQGISKSDFYAL